MSLIAGGAAGGIESFATYPFEFAKTRVQLRAKKGIPTPRNPFIVVGDVIKQEGVRALYLGCSTLVLGTIAKDAIRFVSFDSIKRVFADPETGSLSPLRSLGAGMSAGVVASTFAVTPTERIKTALIDDARANPEKANRKFRSGWHASSTLLKKHGLYGLYRGYVSTTLKQMGTTSARMGSYNILKELSNAYQVPQNTLTTFGNGAVAGIITTYATQPIDTVKTRAQSAEGAGIIESCRGIMADYGIKGFWRGSTMRLGRTVFAGGILFTSYEGILSFLIPVMGNKGEEESRHAVQ